MVFHGYMISDNDVLLVEERLIESFLINIKYDGIVDEEGIPDSTVVCDYASDIGLLNLGDFDGYVFVGDKDKVFREDTEFHRFLLKQASVLGLCEPI